LEKLNNSVEHINQTLQTLILDRRKQGNESSEEDDWTKLHNQRREANPFVETIIEVETTKATKQNREGTT
jgi:hypothetical protein